MLSLVPPDVGLRDAWREAMADYGDGPWPGSGFWGEHRPDTSDAGFAAMVTHRLAEEDPRVPLAPGLVHCSYRWIIDDGELVGFLAVRHELNDHLREIGGHIGYSVRPSRRRKGVATRALAQGLQLARELGIVQALVTCDESNTASARTIERNGGVLEDVRDGKRRYWITLRSRSTAAGAGPC